MVAARPSGSFATRREISTLAASLCLFPFSFTFIPPVTASLFTPLLTLRSTFSSSICILLTHDSVSFSAYLCLSLFPLFFFPYFSRLLFLSSAVPVFTSGKVKGKDKGTFVPALAQALRYEGTGGRRGMAPRILNLGFWWERVFGFTPRLLYPRYPPDRLGVTQRHSGCCRRDEPFDRH